MIKHTFALILMAFSIASHANGNQYAALLAIELPTSINAIESKYGSPYKVELPDPEDPSPWGQWFQWRIKSSGLLLSALGDNYSQKPNHNANVRVLTVKALDVNGTPNSIYGVKLNKTTCAELSSSHKEAFISSIHYSIKFHKNNIWTYYDCNDRGIITQVIQSTFNIDEAD